MDGYQPKLNKRRACMSTDNSLSHTKWNCKYHIVFIPKYKRKEIYGKIKADIGAILRRLCEMKDVEILEEHAMVIISICW